MKIGILTFHASHNFGSMLQAYALQQFLLSLGHEVEFINLRNEGQQKLYPFPLKPQKRMMTKFIMSLLNPIWLYHECIKWRKYERFIKQYLRLSKKVYRRWEDITDDLPELGYHCIITGGDQIWNLNCMDFDKSYFLPSQLKGIRKISYAPSFGGMLPKIDEKKKNFIKDNLSDFTNISVREKSMQDYLTQLLNREIEVTVDPALLLKSTDYTQILPKKKIIQGNYIYYYSPSYNLRHESLATKISHEYGLPIVTSFPHIMFKRGFSSFQESDPADFINLVKNATLVIGKSFHLIVFSLLFHKEFIALDGDKDARIKYILSKLSLLERGIVNMTNYNTITLPSINYERVDKIIDEMRNHSMSVLTEYLKE